jgi:hypothetical protein
VRNTGSTPTVVVITAPTPARMAPVMVSNANRPPSRTKFL